jgi:hypothetical protein
LSVVSAYSEGTTVVIQLAGAIASGFPSAIASDMVGTLADLDPVKTALGYSAVTLAGITDGWVTSTNEWIKQTNQALNLYTAAAVDYDPNGLVGHNTDAVYKEKAYPADPNASIGGFDFLLWGGAAIKTAKFEVGGTAANTGYTNTVYVDYSGVTYTP